MKDTFHFLHEEAFYFAVASWRGRLICIKKDAETLAALCMSRPKKRGRKLQREHEWAQGRSLNSFTVFLQT